MIEVPGLPEGLRSRLIDGQRVVFSVMQRQMVKHIPAPFDKGIEESTQWQEESRTGNPLITRCVWALLSEKPGEDAFILFRVGWKKGDYIAGCLGLGGAPVPGG